MRLTVVSLTWIRPSVSLTWNPYLSWLQNKLKLPTQLGYSNTHRQTVFSSHTVSPILLLFKLHLQVLLSCSHSMHHSTDHNCLICFYLVVSASFNRCMGVFFSVRWGKRPQFAGMTRCCFRNWEFLEVFPFITSSLIVLLWAGISCVSFYWSLILSAILRIIPTINHQVLLFTNCAEYWKSNWDRLDSTLVPWVKPGARGSPHPNAAQLGRGFI